MDWIQVLTIIGVLGAFAIYHANRVDAQIITIENQFLALNQRLDNQSQRLDQLYGMFIDLLKEGEEMNFEQIMKAMGEEVLLRLKDPNVDRDELVAELLKKYSAILTDLMNREKEGKK